ncbi:MAG: Gfo/Idh/MocA family oxidoreductase [Lentisphaeria bacterium]|nr:Gfo/Idh/MocA family oxidoreductase [Lentisphaeria bacterium]
MFKVGIVGCGGIGNAHAVSWSQIEGVQVAAVCDLVPEKAAVFAERYNCTAYTDIADLPDDLDVVSVVTPPAAHYPVVKALLNRKFNVFSEKPLTTDVAQGKELCALAKENGCLLGVGFKMRFEPIFAEAKKLLPEIGELRAIVTTKQQKFNPRPEGAWVKKTGAMYELSIHDFDLVSFITGKLPKQVIAAKIGHRRNWEKDDSFSALVDYGDNVTATLQGMYCDDTTFCFKDLCMMLLGENGYMRVERPDRIIMHTSEYRVVEIGDPEKSAFVLELTHFRDAVLGKTQNTLLPEDAVAMTELIEDIRSFDTFGK